jgi:hypothetical protein
MAKEEEGAWKGIRRSWKAMTAFAVLPNQYSQTHWCIQNALAFYKFHGIS